MHRRGRVKALWTLVLSTLAVPSLLAGQTRSYRRALIYLPDNSRFEAADVRLSDTEVSFVRDQAPSTLALADVAAIRAYTGTNMGRFALLGAATGAASVLLADLSATELTEVSWTPYYVGFAGVGALVGALIGMRNRRYVEVYARPLSRGVSEGGFRVGVRIPAAGGYR